MQIHLLDLQQNMPSVLNQFKYLALEKCRRHILGNMKSSKTYLNSRLWLTRSIYCEFPKQPTHSDGISGGRVISVFCFLLLTDRVIEKIPSPVQLSIVKSGTKYLSTTCTKSLFYNICLHSIPWQALFHSIPL